MIAHATPRASIGLKIVRRNCLDCSGGSPKFVAYCPCDGVHSTRCEFWPFRFGLKPASVAKRYGVAMVTPKMMPPAGIDLDRLPTNPRDWPDKVGASLDLGVTSAIGRD